jgi:fatty acid desaturase
MQQHCPTRQDVVSDLSLFREEIRAYCGGQHPVLFRLNVWRPVFDIIGDWLIIAVSVVAVVELGWWFLPFAVLLIGNRQRSLANILHDAGHGNLCRSRSINNVIASFFVAPLIFADLGTYRKMHFLHHQQLGSEADPDKLIRTQNGSWLKKFVGFLLKKDFWLDSVACHLFSTRTPSVRKLYIISWWAIFTGLLWAFIGKYYLMTFLLLWMTARATAFHAITVFREMCDHYGLVEGGIISYTREIPHSSFWSYLVHPRNNGYHLTHHVLPAVPYYRLHKAQKLISMTPVYQTKCHVCDSYVFCKSAAVQHWSSRN